MYESFEESFNEGLAESLDEQRRRGPERPRDRERPRFRYRYRRPGYYQPYRYGPLYYPGYQQPSYCPYGGTAYTMQEDIDVYTLANQLGVSQEEIVNFNPSLSVNSIIYRGQIICLP